MPVVVPGKTSQNYPTLEGVMNLVRSILNDAFAGATGTPGEGQIITDNATISPATLPFLNSAIREVYRKMRIVGSPTLIRDNYLLIGITPVNGPLGLAVPDPTIQVRIGFDGYDDGSGTINTNLQLPADLIMPIKLWERLSLSEETFDGMHEATDGLPPRYQRINFVDWEYRGTTGGQNDSIYLVGAIETRDMRIRYQAYMPEFFASSQNFSTTQIPIFDCDEAVAYATAYKYAQSLGAAATADLKAQFNEEIFDLRSEAVRKHQSQNWKRRPYGNADEDAWFYPYSF